MISDLDNYRAAQVLVDQHGDLAYMQAVKRRDQMRRQGDAEGWQVWQRIITAVLQLKSDELGGAVH